MPTLGTLSQYNWSTDHYNKWPVTGEITFSSSGTWTVPAGVTSISVVCVGGGGGGGGRAYLSVVSPANVTAAGWGGGGGGGALAYTNNYSVTPGQVIIIGVGYGGRAGQDGAYSTSQFAYAGQQGGKSYAQISGGSTICAANGGSGGQAITAYWSAYTAHATDGTGTGGAGGTVDTGNGNSGGQGGVSFQSYTVINAANWGLVNGGTFYAGGGGGGGAGGYTGSGGKGGNGWFYCYNTYNVGTHQYNLGYQGTLSVNTTGTNGTGGGGGGGGAVLGDCTVNMSNGGNGGGVYLDGPGVAGTYQGGAGDYFTVVNGYTPGTKVSSVSDGSSGSSDAVIKQDNQGPFGGGGGARNGAQGGAVRIIWPGTTRQFPTSQVGFLSY